MTNRQVPSSDGAQAVQDLFSDAAYVTKQLHLVRELMGSRTSTKEQWDAAKRVCGFAALYAPEPLCRMAMAMQQELEMRRLLVTGQTPFTERVVEFE